MIGNTQYVSSLGMSSDELVSRHMHLVKRIAIHLKGRLPDHVEVEDLTQAGLMALLAAARDFDPGKGAGFETYAGIRIRGAMLDEVRAMDWSPRSAHRKLRELADAVRRVENRNGREAQPHEVAEELGVDLDEYHKIAAEVATGRLFSLEQLQVDGDRRVETAGGVADDPLGELEEDELRADLADAIRSLPEREAMVMALYYDEEFNLKEIGKILGVSESRVCQIRGQALVRLRARVEEQQERCRSTRERSDGRQKREPSLAGASTDGFT